MTEYTTKVAPIVRMNIKKNHRHIAIDNIVIKHSIYNQY